MDTLDDLFPHEEPKAPEKKIKKIRYKFSEIFDISSPEDKKRAKIENISKIESAAAEYVLCHQQIKDYRINYTRHKIQRKEKSTTHKKIIHYATGEFEYF